MPDSSLPFDPEDGAQVAARFDAIERSLGSLRLEIERLTSSSPRPSFNEPFVAVSEPVVAEKVTVAARPTVTERPAVAEEAVLSDRQVAPASNLESVFVTRALLFVGVAVLLFGSAYALQFASTHHFIPPRVRISLGLLGGIALLFWGSRLRENTYRYVGEGLIGLGTGDLFLSLWAAVGPYHFISSLVGFVAMAAVTTTVAAFAYVRASERLAFLGLIGGYVTPLLLGHDGSDRPTLAAYLLILGGVMLALGLLGRFRFLNVAVLIAMVLYAQNFAIASDDGWGLRESLSVATLFFFEFSAALIVGARRPLAASPQQLSLVVISVGAYICVLNREFVDSKTILSIALLALAAILLAAASTKLLPALMRVTYGWLAIASVTLGVFAFFSNETLVELVAVEAAVLGIMAARTRNAWIGGGSALLFGIAGLTSMTGTIDGTYAGPAFFSDRFAANAVVVASFVLALWQADVRATRANADQKLAIVFGWVFANAYGLTALSVETIALIETWPAVTVGEHGQFALSILWTAYAAVAFFGGLARGDALWRRIGLALFAVTVMKVFGLDLSFLGVGLRMLSFGALGIVLVLASTLYQRAAAREAK